MGHIHKTISVEPFIGRMGSKIPSINGDYTLEDYTDFGLFPKDILLTNDNIQIFSENVEDVLHLIDTKENGTYLLPMYILEGNPILRYQTFRDLLAYIEKFAKSSVLYRLCVNKYGILEWVELTDRFWEDNGYSDDLKSIDRFFIFDYIISNTINIETSSYTVGDTYLCVNEDADTFISKFRLDSNNIRYEKILYSLKEELMKNKYVESCFSDPFIPLNVLVTQDNRNNGTYIPYTKYWIPKKRYYYNDTVFYTNESGITAMYRLENPDTSLYEIEEITKMLYDINSGFSIPNKYEYYTETDSEDIVHYYRKRWYYKGYLKDGIVYFDEREVTHWEEVLIERGTESEPITAYTKSNLSSFLRLLNSTDEDGNELPFVIGEGNSNTTELQYLIGSLDSYYDDGKRYSDFMYEINFYDESGDTLDYEVGSGGTISVTVSGNLENYKYIGFTYYEDALYEEEGGKPIHINTGIRHDEIYSFSLDEMYARVRFDANINELGWVKREDEVENPTDMQYFRQPTYAQDYQIPRVYKYTGSISSANTIYDRIEGRYIELTNDMQFEALPKYIYFNIDYSKTYSFVEESGFTEDESVISRVTYGWNGSSSEDFVNSEILTDDSYVGFIEIKDNVNVNIERGKSAAFERHNILGEINSLEDMENYRNDMFNISKKLQENQ